MYYQEHMIQPCDSFTGPKSVSEELLDSDEEVSR